MSSGVKDLEKMDMDQLLALKSEVEQRIQTIARTEMSELQEKMNRLKPFVSDGRSGQRKDAGKPAPAKFRDPVSQQTWSGRGRTPIWLRTYEEAGRTRDEFAI